jgi:Tfp pilus assembly protein PilX
MICAREEQGFVLVTAMVLLTVMMGLGLGLLLLTDNQQKASASEQASETAFHVAESALNAQIGQLSREWPGKPGAGGSPEQPRSCTPGTSTSTNYCPDPVSLEKAYPNTGSTSCTGTEAWGSPLTNKWDTYVREDLGGSPYFNSTEESAVTVNDYDGGVGNGTPTSPWKKLWVRAVGVVDCHAVTVVSLVSEQLVHANFPESALSANWFGTGNKGSKVILNHQGKGGAQPGKFTIRCSGYSEAEIKEKKCESYREGQIVPPLTEEEEKPSPTPSTTLSVEQLEEFKAQAKSGGHFYSGANCPGNKELEKLSGQVTYVEGCGELKFTGGAANSPPEKPGFLVLANGSIELDGGAIFYGVIYDANLQSPPKSSEPLVTIKGGAKVVGAIVVDGSGGISLGDKGNEIVAFEYDPTAIHELEIFTGAAGTRNGFRILPAGQ